MFWNKKVDPSPFGVPLNLLQTMLAAGNQKVHRDGNRLISHNGKLETIIEVTRPEDIATEDAPIQAVVTIKTALPKEFTVMIKGETNALNNFAAVGCVYEEQGELFVGSRLTVYEGEDAWDLQIRLLSTAVLMGSDAITGGFLNGLTGKSPSSSGGEPWTEAEFDEAQSLLSNVCFCNAGGVGLTAEFDLDEGAVSAGKRHRTALFQIHSDQPHPFLGDGLFCLLQLPHHIGDESVLKDFVKALNGIEMQGGDMPPHFGAWCKNQSGDGIAYVSFLPNALHQPGIHINMVVWAMHRALIVDGMLRDKDA